MNNTKFCIELVMDDVTIEERLKKIVNYIRNSYPQVKCVIINDIEASGPHGAYLTTKNENETHFDSDISDIEKILNEDGQVFELNVEIETEAAQFKIIIRDGTDLDILSNDYRILDKSILGNFQYLDLDLFNEGHKAAEDE